MSGTCSYDGYGPAWLFDDSPIPDPTGIAEESIRFIKGFLKHPLSTAPDNAFQLDRWQERFLRKMIGPVDENGERLCRNAYAQLGKGSRKSSLAAACAILWTFGPLRRPLQGSVVCASDKEQANYLFEEALKVVYATPKLDGAAKSRPSKFRIMHPKSGAFFDCISSESEKIHGRSVGGLSIVDELWAHRNSKTYEAIVANARKVPGSLVLCCTTAGRGAEAPDYAHAQYARKVASGEIDDPRFLSVIFETPPDARWDDPETWRKALPGLDNGYPDLAGLKDWANQIKQGKPAEEAVFRQFILGQRQATTTVPAFDLEAFDRGRVDFKPEDMTVWPSWVAADCSTKIDITAVSIGWRVECGSPARTEYWVDTRCFVPEATIRKKSELDRAPYELWAKGGWIIPTPGEEIDPRFVKEYIARLCDEHDVQEVGFDEAYSFNVRQPLQDDGINVVIVPQGVLSQGPALTTLEGVIASGRLKWNSPVLRWCVDNAVCIADKNGNKSLHKGKSRDRIDAATTLWMLIQQMDAYQSPNILESENFDPSKWFVTL